MNGVAVEGVALFFKPRPSIPRRIKSEVGAGIRAGRTLHVGVQILFRLARCNDDFTSASSDWMEVAGGRRWTRNTVAARCVVKWGEGEESSF